MSKLLKRFWHWLRCEDENGNPTDKPWQAMKTLSQEEWEKCEKMNRAGKTYAKVKRSNPNPSYRCKRGQVVDKSPTGYCLEIETVNTVSDSGFSTLIGVIYPHGYEKIWFNADEVEDFESYDENGEQQKEIKTHEH